MVKREERISVVVTENEKQLIETIADRQNRSVSNYIRHKALEPTKGDSNETKHDKPRSHQSSNLV
jgi:uncharacterized protein (DUF1778 family)